MVGRTGPAFISGFGVCSGSGFCLLLLMARPVRCGYFFLIPPVTRSSVGRTGVGVGFGAGFGFLSLMRFSLDRSGRRCGGARHALDLWNECWTYWWFWVGVLAHIAFLATCAIVKIA